LFACVHADERTSQVGWFCIVVCRLIYAKFARLRGEEGFFSLFVPFHHSCLHPHPTPRPAPSLFELRYADILPPTIFFSSVFTSLAFLILYTPISTPENGMIKWDKFLDIFPSLPWHVGGARFSWELCVGRQTWERKSTLS